MYNLYYNHSRKTMRLGRNLPPRNVKVTVFASGPLRFRRSLAGGHYAIDIGDFTDALHVLPTVTNTSLILRVWSPKLTTLPETEFTPQMRGLLKTVLYDADLREQLWNFIGIQSQENFENAVTIRTIPIEEPYADGGAPWRLCEASVHQNRSFMIAVDSRRSMSVVTRLRLVRNGPDVATFFPGHAHAKVTS